MSWGQHLIKSAEAGTTDESLVGDSTVQEKGSAIAPPLEAMKMGRVEI